MISDILKFGFIHSCKTVSLLQLIVYSFLGLLLCQDSEAQQMPAVQPVNEVPIQSAYVEIGGPGIIYSVNYDAIFSNGWGIRIGGGYIPEERLRTNDSGRSEYFGTKILTGIIMAEYVSGKRSHKFESAAGVVFGETNLEDSRINPPGLPGIALSVGYRLLPEEPGKLTFKVAYTPVLSGRGLFNSFGLSIGFVVSGTEGD